MGKRKSTSSSSFGTSGKISHDSSRFYSSKLYEGLQRADAREFIENQLPPGERNRLHCKSSESMAELPDHSIHLMVTSPPYNASKDYDEDLTLQEYLIMLERVFKETYRVLVTGGRACVNVANLGRKPYLPLNAFITHLMLDLGFLMRGEIIWNKGGKASPSTAWGTWMSATNPVLRDVHEYILVFSKGSFSRGSSEAESTITRDGFLELTKSVWDMAPVSARQIGHPAPFPVDLPRRLIELYSFQGDIVLDPFCGSGTTCVAALASGRNYVGYDKSPDYIELAKTRLEQLDKP
jgi:site-specific DNA-methyltransferase (adenine-specific)